MGSNALINYEMSPRTRGLLQGQCEFLRSAKDEGSFFKTTFGGRALVALSCVVLHAEFFLRCLLVIALSMINCVVRFKKEQITIQVRQAYTALSASALCFRTLFQSEMVQPFEQWLNPVQEELTHAAAPQKQQMGSSTAVSAVSCNPPQVVSSIPFASEKPAFEEAVQSKKAYDETRLVELMPAEGRVVNHWMQECHQAANTENEVEQSIDCKTVIEELPTRQERESSYVVQSAFYNSIRDTEIQTVVDSFKSHGQNVQLISLLEPMETGPRTAMFVRNHLKKELKARLKKETVLNDSAIFNAFRRTCYKIQDEIEKSLAEETLHEYLAPFAEQTSSMTTVLIVNGNAYVFNIGGSRAVLNNDGKCIALTTSAEPTVNSDRVKRRGGKIKDGKVNGHFPFATAFGGKRLHGATSGLNSVTKFPAALLEKGQLLLVTNTIYNKTGRKALTKFVHKIKQSNQENPPYASALLSAVVNKYDIPNVEDLGLIVISALPSPRMKRSVSPGPQFSARRRANSSSPLFRSSSSSSDLLTLPKVFSFAEDVNDGKGQPEVPAMPSRRESSFNPPLFIPQGLSSPSLPVAAPAGPFAEPVRKASANLDAFAAEALALPSFRTPSPLLQPELNAKTYEPSKAPSQESHRGVASLRSPSEMSMPAQPELPAVAPMPFDQESNLGVHSLSSASSLQLTVPEMAASVAIEEIAGGKVSPAPSSKTAALSVESLPVFAATAPVLAAAGDASSYISSVTAQPVARSIDGSAASRPLSMLRVEPFPEDIERASGVSSVHSDHMQAAGAALPAPTQQEASAPVVPSAQSAASPVSSGVSSLHLPQLGDLGTDADPEYDRLSDLGIAGMVGNVSLPPAVRTPSPVPLAGLLSNAAPSVGAAAAAPAAQRTVPGEQLVKDGNPLAGGRDSPIPSLSGSWTDVNLTSSEGGNISAGYTEANLTPDPSISGSLKQMLERRLNALKIDSERSNKQASPGSEDSDS